jgi:hypothetical protein
MGDDDDISEENLTPEYHPIHAGVSVLPLTCPIFYRCRREKGVFKALLGVVPRLVDRLTECSEEEALEMADLVRHFLPTLSLF